MIDPEKYLNMIHDSNLKIVANMQYGLRLFMFLQDYAPTHTSAHVQQIGVYTWTLAS